MSRHELPSSNYQIHYSVRQVYISFDYPDGTSELAFDVYAWWQNPLTGAWFRSSEHYEQDEWTQGGVDFLGKLQAVHDGGHFRNGQSMTSPIVMPQVEFQGNIFDLPDWEERGGFNPLDMNGMNKYRTGQKFTGRFAQEGAVQADGLELTTGFEVKPSRHTGGTVALNEWVVDTRQLITATAFTATPTTYQSFILTIDIEEYHRITLAELHNYPPVAALIGLLNDRRQNANTMSAITGQGVYAFGNPSVHRFFVKNINNTDAFKIFFYSTAKHVPDGYVTQLQIFGLVDPDDTADYSHDTLQRDLNRISRHVPAETVYTQNPFGVRETNFKARQIELNDTTIIESINGLLRYRVRNPGANVDRLVPVGSTGVIDYEDLTPVNDDDGNETHRVMKTPYEAPLAHVYHHYGSTNKVLRILNPEQANGHNGAETEIKVENQGTGTLQVHDWEGRNIVTLRPDEFVELAFVYDTEGTSRVIGKVPERYIEASAGNIGNIDQLGYYDFSTSHWARPIQVTTPSHIDTDAFEVGTNTNRPGGTQWSAANIVQGPDTFKVLKNGTLEFHQSILFTVVGNGNMPAGSLARVYLLRGSTLTSIDESSYGEIAGSGVSRTFRWGFRRRVQKDDVIIPLLIYPKSSTINIGICQITDFIRTVTLDQTVAIEYVQPETT